MSSDKSEPMHFADDDAPMTFSDDAPMTFSDDEKRDTGVGENQAQSMDSNQEEKRWKILIADDEPEIHSITKMVMKSYSFEGKKLQCYSTYSGKETIAFMRENPDVALILLDVVMESEHAGLECVKAIREELHNSDVQIILRTGQPGQAPEEEVIVNYDINDYKAKTELTTQKLFTVVIAALRSYNYIQMINHSRRGLENIIVSSQNLFNVNSFSLFATGILEQLISLLQLDEDSLYVNISSLSAFQDRAEGDFTILAATGAFNTNINQKNCSQGDLPQEVCQSIKHALKRKESCFTATSYTGYFESHKGEHNIIYLQWERTITEIDKKLISLYASNIAISFENISLNRDIIATQKEVIFTLAELVEGRSKETANHIRRVAAVSSMLAAKIGLSEEDCELLRLAAPMHDIGKIATPDSILKKPGKLTPEEYEIMKEHAALGYSVFKNSDRKMMRAAAIIANEHHEKWNGTGYPQGKKGEEIHIYGRITALADVVDALTNKRCYKEAWEMDRVLALVKEERGEHFDPQIVDAFLDSVAEYEEIQRIYPS